MASSEIQLTVEHRAEPSCDPLALRLVSEGDLADLQIACTTSAPPEPTPLPPPEQLLEVLAQSHQPLRVRTSRRRAGLRNKTVSLAVAELAERGLIESTRLGSCLANPPVS